jgi:hypothetical protein
MFKKFKGWFTYKKVLIKRLIEQGQLIRGLEDSLRLLKDEQDGIISNHLFLLKCLILQHEGDVVISPEMQNLAGQDDSQACMGHSKDGSLVLKLKEPDEFESEEEFLEDE